MRSDSDGPPVIELTKKGAAAVLPKNSVSKVISFRLTFGSARCLSRIESKQLRAGCCSSATSMCLRFRSRLFTMLPRGPFKQTHVRNRQGGQPDKDHLVHNYIDGFVIFLDVSTRDRGHSQSYNSK